MRLASKKRTEASENYDFRREWQRASAAVADAVTNELECTTKMPHTRNLFFSVNAHVRTCHV